MSASVILFAIAALGGAAMAAMRFGGKELPPTALALAHGLIAAAGLITLIVTVKGSAVPTMVAAAIVGFIIAALGGLAMFVLFHMKHRALPIPLMLVHASVAVISFVILLLQIFNT